MPSLIDIIIRATWAGSQATRQAKSDLAGIDDGAKKGAGGLESFAKKAALAGVAIGTVTAATKLAYDTLERGAGLELTRQRFDRLALSIGTTGDELRAGLSESTAGLLSDAQQMALATDLIALGLANDADQAVRLARGVAELDQDVGELSLALVNQTTRRFDQLNVSAVGFEERLESLKEQGLDTQEAFTEAFLQQVEEQIERVGGKVGTAAGELDTLEASIKNVKDAAAEALLDVVRFAGGFEDIGEAAEALDRLAEKIERIGDNFDRILAIGQIPRLIANPGGIDEVFEDVLRLQRQWSDEISNTLLENERYQAALDTVADTLRDIGDFIGIEIIGNMEGAVEEAESFDRALQNVNNTLTQITGKLEKVSEALPGRDSFERGDGADGRSGEIIRQQFGTIQERVDLFQQFQSDLTAINEDGARERVEIEADYEARRAAIVADYGRLRAQEEGDWQRRQAREEARYRTSIEDARGQTTEAEQDAREKANKNLRDLERDHLKRLREITENEDVQLKEAAAQLSATGIRQARQNAALARRREEENYQSQRTTIQEQLQEQLQVIRDNLQKRLTDLQEFHERRQKEEEEDRQVRLERMEEAHRRELTELDTQYRDRIKALKEHIRQERQELTDRYKQERLELTQHWDDRESITAGAMAEILRLEEQWWNDRAALVGGTTGRGDTGGDTGGVTAGGDATPDRGQLLDLVRELSSQAGYPVGFVVNLLRAMQSWTDLQIARWLESVFGIDIPGYAAGTAFVPKTGLALVHEGERIVTAADNRSGRYGNNITIQAGAIQITAAPGMSEAMVGRVVLREIEDFLRDMQP